MLGTLPQNDGRQAAPAFTIKKRATAEEIQADLQERIDRLVARDATFKGCTAALPRLVPAHHDGGPNWTVNGFPGLPSGGFGALVKIVDQARQEYELVG
jgi:hypothetical protein